MGCEETSLASTCDAFISAAKTGHIAQKTPPPPAPPPPPPTSVSAEASLHLIRTPQQEAHRANVPKSPRQPPSPHHHPPACSRRTGSLFNSQTAPVGVAPTHPPLHTAHSTSLGPGVLPGVPFGKRCQRDNMDVSWWWWVGGVWGSGQRQPHQPQFNSLYSNYCSPLLPPPAIARLYQAARPRR